MAALKKTPINVVVNGQPTVVDAVREDALGSIIEPALHQTGNSGQPPGDWELRDADGSLLDLDKKIEDYPFTEKIQLFLTLKAGVGIPLTVVVNGQPTVIDAVVEDLLRSVIEPALRQTGNSGQPPENWELRDADGDLYVEPRSATATPLVCEERYEFIETGTNTA